MHDLHRTPYPCHTVHCTRSDHNTQHTCNVYQALSRVFSPRLLSHPPQYTVLHRHPHIPTTPSSHDMHYHIPRSIPQEQTHTAGMTCTISSHAAFYRHTYNTQQAWHAQSHPTTCTHNLIPRSILQAHITPSRHDIHNLIPRSIL